MKWKNVYSFNNCPQTPGPLLIPLNPYAFEFSSLFDQKVSFWLSFIFKLLQFTLPEHFNRNATLLLGRVSLCSQNPTIYHGMVSAICENIPLRFCCMLKWLRYSEFLQIFQLCYHAVNLLFYYTSQRCSIRFRSGDWRSSWDDFCFVIWSITAGGSH